jgi:hypothetical protein
MKYRKVIVEKEDGTRIPEDEPVFVLRAQDILAPIAVRFYAELVLGATDDFRKAVEIQNIASLMTGWKKRKLPD